MRVLAMAILMTALCGCATSPLSTTWGTAEVVARAPQAAPPDRQAALDAYWRESRDAQQRRELYDALHPAPPEPASAVDQTIQADEASPSEERRLARESAARRDAVRRAAAGE